MWYWWYCWLADELKSLHNIIARKLAGEGNSVNTEVVDAHRSDVALSLLTRYAPDDLYNTDEAGLMPNTALDKTLTFKGDKSKGTKQDNKRITLLFTTNMTGSDKRNS